MYNIYVNQHNIVKINEDTKIHNKNIKEFPEMNELLNQYLVLKTE